MTILVLRTKPRKRLIQPSTRRATTAKVHEFPGVLGQMKVKRHETLGGLIQTIYGVFTKAHLQSVLRINPHITDPNTINVGDIILFPAITSNVEQQPLKRWWVQIAQEDNLEAVFKFLRQRKAGASSAHLVPYWNRSTGLRFSVLLAQPFFDEASAENKLKLLRLSGNATSSIVSEWDNHTVFYANPYLNTNT